jgi:hypothetical protein
MRRAATIAAAGLALTLLPAGAARASRTLTAPPTASFTATLDGSDQTVSFALPLTAAVTAASPAAAANTGIRTFTVTPTISVTIPANVRAGSYTSTITTAIVAGP